MSEKIGYSLVELATGEEVAWSQVLPWTVDYSGGTVSFDKVGLEVPDSIKPTHRVVERWQINDPPPGHKQVGYGTPHFDGTKVNVSGDYKPLPKSGTKAESRKEELRSDADVKVFYNKIKNANSAQIDAWLAVNVTDIDSTRRVLARMIKYMASR